MNRICKAVPLVAFIALFFSGGPAFTETTTAEPAATASPVAYVYVQTHEGVDVYDASASGKLTLVKGSPFATVGQMGGINGKYLISVGTNYVRSYAIESNGAVGKQTSEINTQSYGGAECGGTSSYGNASYSQSNGAVLDHTGKYFYIQLWNGDAELCAAWQTYQIDSNGELKFINFMEYENWSHGQAVPSAVPSISGNDDFGYGTFPSDGGNSFSWFLKTSEGTLEENTAFTEIDPVGNPDGAWYYGPVRSRGDPTNHLAVLMVSLNAPPYPNQGPYQLASYTINDATGGIVSKNTWENMPTPDIQSYINAMSMSPSGKVVALAGYPGLELFHFNGAAPITTYSPLLLPTVDIDQLAWDNNNHLFALSYKSGEMYVYTTTPTQISQVQGSPYKVENAYGISGLIVVPKP